MSASALEDLRRAKQGAKNFHTETHILQKAESEKSAPSQERVSVKAETRRITVTLDARDFYAFKAWCFSQDAQRNETINMTVVVSALIHGVLEHRIDPFGE